MRSGAEATRHGDGSVEGVGQDVAGKAVRTVVGDVDGFLLAVIGDHDENGTEDLLSSNAHAVVDVHEESWRDVEPSVTTLRCLRTSNQEGGAFSDPLLDVPDDPGSLLRRYHRPAERVRKLRVTDGDGLINAPEKFDAFVVAGAGQQHPRWRCAPLPCVHADAEGDHAGGAQVCVVEHDRGRLSPELKEQPLHRGSALLHDPLADRRRTGE